MDIARRRLFTLWLAGCLAAFAACACIAASRPGEGPPGPAQDGGTYQNPRNFGQSAQAGDIYEWQVYGDAAYFAARFNGVSSDAATPKPQGRQSNTWWEFKSKHAGTFSDPKTWSDYSLVGDINVYERPEGSRLFRARRAGRPSDFNWYYPTTETDNAFWEYVYTHEGTPSDPKGWNEWTRVGELHRYYHNGNTAFYRAKSEGNPSKSNWYYPVPNADNNHWSYAGAHAGTVDDPKGWSEPTWPGAVHWYKSHNLYFTSKVSGTPSAHNWYYPTTASSNHYWNYIDRSRFSTTDINDFSKRFDQYTWVTAHNAYLNNMSDHLNRGVRGFMLDLHYGSGNEVKLCHGGADHRCGANDARLSDVLTNVFLPYLRNNRQAVITLIFESYVSREAMQVAMDRAGPFSRYVYVRPPVGNEWPTLQKLIDDDKRLLLFANSGIGGHYQVGGNPVDIQWERLSLNENTYDLGLTIINHDWSCKPKYELELSERTAYDGRQSFWPRLVVLNQFHSWGSFQLHAADVDNNLTYLKRRVERYCAEPTRWRTPNYIALDYSQVGDAMAYAAALSQGGIYFYEGNNADANRDTSCVLPLNSSPNAVEYDITLKAKGCENDELRSLELRGVKSGTRIELYDSPQASRQDDFTIIDVKQSIPMRMDVKQYMPSENRVVIGSFEGSEETFWYRKLAFRNNGLDGKVSRIKVYPTPENVYADGMLVFHEGNNGTQNIVCAVPFVRAEHFQMGAGNNAYGCDNDEIRSGTVFAARKGAAFTLVGHPGGEYSQGRANVVLKRNILQPVVIPSFNRSYENADVRVEVSHGGNLDGKISYGWFNPIPPPEPEPEPDPGPAPIPGAPTNMHFDNQWTPERVLWNRAEHAVKYRVYQWFTQIGETTNPYLDIPTPTNYTRYHVRAVNRDGKMSPASNLIYYYPSGLRRPHAAVP